MQRYEITFLTRSEDDHGDVSDLIAQLGGQIETQVTPVRRKLAYPIKREQAAVYYTYLFMIDPTKLPELDQKLSRGERVLRHLVIAGGIRQPMEEPAKTKPTDLEIPESLVKGMAELAAAEQVATAAAARGDVLTSTQTTPADEAAPAAPTDAETADLTAEQVTADERQKKLDEKLKKILEG